MNDLTDTQLTDIKDMTNSPGWTVLKEILTEITNAIRDKHFISGPHSEATYIRDIAYVQALTGVMNIVDNANELLNTLLTKSHKESTDARPQDRGRPRTI